MSRQKGGLAISCKHLMGKKLTFIAAAGEHVMRLCCVKLKLWPYSVLHCIEPCGFWLGIHRFVVNGRLASKVEFTTTNMALVPRDTTQLKSWSSHPCIQWTVPASDEQPRFIYGLVLILSKDI